MQRIASDAIAAANARSYWLPLTLMALSSFRHHRGQPIGLLGAAVLLTLSAGGPAAAQALAKPEAEAVAAEPPDSPTPADPEALGFTADQLAYDSARDVVTASGNVVVRREGNVLRADAVTWDRKSGQVVATGDVSVTAPNGDVAYGDTVEVTESLKDGIVQGLLIVTERGDRIAAETGERKDATFILTRAAYSPCPVADDSGCPRKPSWQIKAAHVVYDSARARVRYSGARLEMFGVPLLPLPGLTHPLGSGGGSGFLVPDVGIDALNGGELAVPYYFYLEPNRDLTVTPHIFTNTWPMLEAQYRALLSSGAYQISGYATYSSRANPSAAADMTATNDVRGYIDASGKFQLDPLWSITGSLRRASDRTFLNRYDISRDDRLRSMVNAERIGQRSYLSIAGWSFQTLRSGDPQGQVPIALPAVDYRLRVNDPWLGGVAQLQLNSLAITRTEGQDTQRAFAGLQWQMSRLTGLGQEVTVTGYARGDVYHTAQTLVSDVYAGEAGWQSRGIATLALDMRWPFVGSWFGGTQQITPRVQLVVSPTLRNLGIPNEDARAIDLEDSNLFALNRFPGYDRFEDSSRVTYGLDYGFDRPHLSVEANIGQSYRLNNRASILPDGTGLSDRLSDFVGRVAVRYDDFIAFTHRFRLDKDTLAVRRNEIDATVGSRATYAKVSYVKLNRNIASATEDLRDIEEVRVGGRLAFARYWSVFGSATVDLTGYDDDQSTTLDGYTPVRHRLGVSYQDDCLELSFTWQREYQSFGDARRGNSFLVRLAFRNLGI